MSPKRYIAVVIDPDLCDFMVDALLRSGFFMLFLSPVRVIGENWLLGHNLILAFKYFGKGQH